MSEECGSAGPTGWRSGTSRTPRSVPSRCRSTSRPPCATWRSIGRTYGSRPTAGWCAWRATRRCDEPPPPARPRGRVRPAAPHLRPARAGGGARLGRRLCVDLGGRAGARDDARPEHRSERRGRAFSHRSEEHTSELQSLAYLVCRLLLEKKKNKVNVDERPRVLSHHLIAHEQQHAVCTVALRIRYPQTQHYLPPSMSDCS